jgi:superfamily I DNA/RNA helicase
MPTSENKYIDAISERKKHIDAILCSPSDKKVVVAGPGTGKTYLFKELLKGKRNTLTLSFVNALIEDLSLELCGLSEVRTLHSFARSELSKAAKKDINLFPKLPEVINEDAAILLDKDIDFDKIFHNRDDNNEYIPFYKKRKDYYDGFYGYADVIFAIVKYFENKKECIPKYEQIVVDEFQDFNKVEVSLIELLATKSPILLAGDDDQALYAFKSASADYIRHKHSDACPEYVSFNLPFCSRCTRVIVDAANDIICAATKSGLLKGRINKPFKYFEDQKKDAESSQNPKIIYNKSFAKQIPWFIQQRISEIAEEVKKSFSVLIISPTKNQSKTIVKALREKGFGSIQYVEKKNDNELTLIDGLKILLEDGKSNLGWRIVSKVLLNKLDFDNMLKETSHAGSKPICEIIGKEMKKEIVAMLKICRCVKDDKVIDEKQFDETLRKLSLNPYEIAKDFLKDELENTTLRAGNPGLRKIPIKATTIQSSKGLAAEYVFITNFDDQFFIKDKDKTKISDQDVCNFLVALTRARRKIFLVSTDAKKEPTFIKWVDESHIEKIE